MTALLRVPRPFATGSANAAALLSLCLLGVSCGPSDPEPTAPGAAPARSSAPGDARQAPRGDTADTEAGEQDPAPKRTGADAGFESWKQDFPNEVYLSPPVAGQWYGFTRRQALDRVIGKLQGGCTRKAWLMAKQYFSHAPEEAVEPLIEAMDEALQSHHLSDRLENIVEALGRLKHLARPAIGEALLRALGQHKKSIRNKAMAALRSVGPPDAVRRSGAMLASMTRRARIDWVRAVGEHLPEAEDIYREMLTSDQYQSLLQIVIEEVVKLPPEQAARLLEPLWADAQPWLRMVLAMPMHAAGNPRGTRFLLDTMRQGEAGARAQAIMASQVGDLSLLMDDILRLSADDNDRVRASVSVLLSSLDGERYVDVLHVLANDPVVQVRQPALAALQMRGVQGHLDTLLEEARSATGTELFAKVSDLVAARDGRVVEILVERMRKSAPDETRKFMQAIGLSPTAEAFAALRAVFLEPERKIDLRGELTSLTYAGVLFPNMRQSQDAMLTLLAELPKQDYRRRSVALTALGNMAADTDNKDFTAKVNAGFRAIAFDTTELPQLRLLCLDYLARDLDLDDMRQLKKLQGTEKNEPMRKALTAFLFEFF